MTQTAAHRHQLRRCRSARGRKRVACVLRLVYCGSYLNEGSIDAVDEPQYKAAMAAVDEPCGALACGGR